MSQILSVTIVVITVIDLVFNPKDKWMLFSKASDLLTIAQIKQEGNYEKYKDILETVLKTESANLERLVDLDTVINSAETANSKK